MSTTSTKQKIGVAFIFVVLLCTLLGVAGIWGFIDGDVGWQIFWTLIVCAVGLGTAGGMIDTFFKDKTSVILLAIALSAGSVGYCQEPPQPTPDPATNAEVVEGPISDLIEKRLEERLDKKHAEVYGSILSDIAEARRERQNIFESIQELRSERNGLISRFTEMRDNFDAWRIENQKQREEWTGLVGRWTPLQNLVERLTGLVWKLFGFVIALCCLVFLLAVLAAVLWRKVNNLPSTIANAVVKT